MKWTFTVTKVPIDVAPLYHVEGDLTRDGFTWAVKDGPDGQPLDPPVTWVGCEVRVRARFNASERALITEKLDWSEFRDAKRFEVELIAVPDRALRAPKVAAARTLPDKVAAWAEVNGAVVTEDVLAKLAQIEHGDPEAVLVEVAKQLGAIVAPEQPKDGPWVGAGAVA